MKQASTQLMQTSTKVNHIGPESAGSMLVAMHYLVQPSDAILWFMQPLEIPNKQKKFLDPEHLQNLIRLSSLKEFHEKSSVAFVKCCRYRHSRV